MKSYWWRVVLLISVLVIPVSANADSSEYGTCYIYCSGQAQCVQSFTTAFECCSQTQAYICPDNSYPSAIIWEPYAGWPILCGPWAE